MDREIVGIVIAALVTIATWEAARWALRYLESRFKRRRFACSAISFGETLSVKPHAPSIADKKPPGERSAIKITGRGDGLTTGIHDALTGVDLGARYGVRKVELKIVGEDWDGATLVLELVCPVIAELSGCWPPVTKPD